MKAFWNSHRRDRDKVGLLAAGRLPEPERAEVERNLAVCAECRARFAEIKAVTLQLAEAESVLPAVASRPEFTRHWMELVHAARRGGNSQPRTAAQRNAAVPAVSSPGVPPGIAKAPGSAMAELFTLAWWTELLQAWPKAWVGLGAAWALILFFDLSTPRLGSGTFHPSDYAKNAIPAIVEERQILASLLAAPPPPVSPVLPPKPRTQRRVEFRLG